MAHEPCERVEHRARGCPVETFPPPTEGERLCGRELAPRGSCVIVNLSEEGAVSGDPMDHVGPVSKGSQGRQCWGFVEMVLGHDSPVLMHPTQGCRSLILHSYCFIHSVGTHGGAGEGGACDRIHFPHGFFFFLTVVKDTM